jgi:hypothetical protein
MKYLVIRTDDSMFITEDPVRDFEEGKLHKRDKIYSLGPETRIKIGLDSFKMTRSINPHDDR